MFLLAAILMGFPVSASPLDFSVCRARIEKVVCLVDQATDAEDYFRRTCLPGGESYAGAFQGHFDRAPEVLQKMYCSLDRIFIEKDFVGTAYAGVHIVNGKTIGARLGIRKEVLDEKITMDRWLSWKEEMSFGGSVRSGDSLLGVFDYRSNISTHDFFLDYVIAHEMGHLFDFANGLNPFDDCREEETADGEWRNVGQCTPAKNSFAELSWDRIDRARGADEYPLREKQCSYFCNGHFIPRDQSAEMFAQLMQTSFVSPYASRYAAEDWAETFAVSILSWERGFRWGVRTQSVYFDLNAHFESDLLKAKRSYVRDFLSKPFYYPGESPSISTSPKIIFD